MRRKQTMAILILVSIILQSTVCQMISIASIKPNLLIILTVSFGLMRGKKSGMLTGFFCGLLTDIFFNSIIGFNALIYLYDRKLYPLQMFLREILIENQMSAQMLMNGQMNVEDLAAKQAIAELLKYALIVVASIPVMCVYPFIQRYFVKGVMIGSIKG